MRLIGLSQAEREAIDRLSPHLAAEAQYRISRCETDPESWVIERVEAGGTAAEPLIQFDSQAEAERVMAHFASRRRGA